MYKKNIFPKARLRRVSLFLLVLTLFSAIFVAWLDSDLQAAQAADLPGEGYWHTSGNKILDANNQQVRLTGVAWFGFETEKFVPHGLWARSYKSILQQIRDLGYNTIRLPYSTQLFDSDSFPSGFNSSVNPDLVGLTGLQIMDKIVAYAGQLKLRIILDRHSGLANHITDLWYDEFYTEQRWLEDWRMLAQRYLYNTTVIGADLHNEPHGTACWGCGNTNVDWRLAAERAGNAILQVNPNWLIFVEGTQGDTWWGGELRGVRQNPVRLNVPNKLVYAPHEYGPSLYCQWYFYQDSFPNNLFARWDEFWGFIHKENIAPVWLGEFGTDLALPANTPCKENGKSPSDAVWFPKFLEYLNTNGISWSFWSYNPNTKLGGLLTDVDNWSQINQAKQNYLAPLQFKLAAPTSFIVAYPNDGIGQTGVSGTLSWALTQARENQQILFDLPQGSQSIVVASVMPPLQKGASIKAGCQKPITLNGAGNPNSGLRLSGQNALQGLRINGFGRQQLNIKGSQNRLTCFRISD